MNKLEPKPWMPPDAVSFLGDIVRDLSESRDPVRVLEFGAGSSTVWFDNAGCRVVSVEHNLKWLERVKKSTTWHTFLVYHQTPYAGITEYFPDGLFDIVLVDGRRRVECLERSIRLVAPGGWLILDDANRPRYVFAHRAVENVGWEKHVKVSTGTTLQMVQNAPQKKRTTVFWRRPNE